MGTLSKAKKLTTHEQKILTALRESAPGWLQLTRENGPNSGRPIRAQLNVNGTSLVPDSDAADKWKLQPWLAGFFRLVRRGYIRHVTSEFYEITYSGLLLAEDLEALEKVTAERAAMGIVV